MVIELTSDLIAQLQAHAAAAHPQECCGLLLGQGGKIIEAQPASNVHQRPQTHFEIDPQALVDAHRAQRQGGPDIIGYYHSHPDGPAKPSQTDAAMASGDGRVWAIIGANGQLRLWQDNPGGFEERPHTVA